jgi:RNA polymerase sigma factor (sigma-70 family)
MAAQIEETFTDGTQLLRDYGVVKYGSYDRGQLMEVSTLTHPSAMAGLRGPSAMLRLQSDEKLIALTRRGHHAAFETLCSRYQSRLLSFCRHMLNSREDAEDVLQEVYAAAFNAVLADEREINVKPWLYRIARNRSLNHLRRASATGVDSMDIHFAEHGTSTSDKVLKRESFRELIADVHDLPETQRTALLLREIDALSYDQIAVAMDTTVPSVKSLLVRARISLAEAAESRKLSCEDVRLELGAAAEGLTKLSTAGRRHVRGCDRCAFFKKQLKENNHALAAILPVGPLFMFKKLLLAKLGSTASAGGAHATVGAGATVSAAAGATAAAGTSSGMAGGLLTAGAGALATKAVAGLAAAAIVTAGAVAADHAVTPVHHHHSQAALAATTSYAPVVYHQVQQPDTVSAPSTAIHHLSVAARLRHARELAAAKAASVAAATPAVALPVAASAVPAAPAATTPTVPTPAPAQPQDQVTEVTSTTTALPTAATEAPATSTTSTTPQPIAEAPASTTTIPTTTTPPVTTEASTTPPPAEETPVAQGPGGTPAGH